MILVTGATGKTGTEVVKLLSHRGAHVRVFVRGADRAMQLKLPGVAIAQGDFSKLQTFPPALDGVERLFLLIPSSAEVEIQQKRLVDAAKAAGVRHIVKLSQLGADARAVGRFQRYHGAVEDYIRQSGVEYTFLRPNLFMQGFLAFLPMIAQHRAIYAAGGDAAISIVDVRDVAEIAACALLERGHEGKVYEITGPEAITHAQMADILSRAFGKTIKYVNISPEVMRDALRNIGMPDWEADGLVEEYEVFRRGEASKVTLTVQEITKKAPRSFREFARDYSEAFHSTLNRAA